MASVYYLRWITPLLRVPAPPQTRQNRALLRLAGSWGKLAAYSAALASLAVAVAAGPALALVAEELVLG